MFPGLTGIHTLPLIGGLPFPRLQDGNVAGTVTAKQSSGFFIISQTPATLAASAAAIRSAARFYPGD
jgi:hypothetical protein